MSIISNCFRLCLLEAVSLVVAGGGARGGEAITPPPTPSMAVVVEAGVRTVRGHTLNVVQTTRLGIDSPARDRVEKEPVVLTQEQAREYMGGASLKKTIDPAEPTRLIGSIVPESVKVRSEDGATLFDEDKDYKLDHLWAGMSQVEAGRIHQGQIVHVDYEVYRQRVDIVQVSRQGVASIKKGESVAVSPRIPAPDQGCVALGAIYVPYRATAITADLIFPGPEHDITWRDLIKVSGREHLISTLAKLKAGQPVTIVCWGDSITAGGTSSTPEKSYVKVFQALLQSAYPRATITVINAGIGGSDTKTRREGYARDVLKHSPDLITVEFLNDVGFGTETIKKNWAEFIARAREENPDVEFILCTPHPMRPEWSAEPLRDVPSMRQAAADNRVALADVIHVWYNLRTVGVPYMIHLQNVMTHPDDEGHAYFAESMMKLLEP